MDEEDNEVVDMDEVSKEENELIELHHEYETNPIDVDKDNPERINNQKVVE